MTDALRAAPPLAVAVLERGLAALRVGERERPRAHTVVQVVLDLVDRGGARVRLRPEVARIDRVAAQLEADQVVLLERRRRARGAGTAARPFALRAFVYETGGRIVRVQP